MCVTRASDLGQFSTKDWCAEQFFVTGLLRIGRKHDICIVRTVQTCMDVAASSQVFIFRPNFLLFPLLPSTNYVQASFRPSYISVTPWLDDTGSVPAGTVNFVFDAASRSARRPSQPLIQRVPPPWSYTSVLTAWCLIMHKGSYTFVTTRLMDGSLKGRRKTLVGVRCPRLSRKGRLNYCL